MEFVVLMPEFDRLDGSSIGIQLEFVDREQIPRELILHRPVARQVTSIPGLPFRLRCALMNQSHYRLLLSEAH